MKHAKQTIIKNDVIHYYKKISYNFNLKHKIIEFMYDIYENNEIKYTNYHNTINNPAIIKYINNKITTMEYWFKGELHRNYGPAIIHFKNNKKIEEIWYKHNIKLHDNDVSNIKKIINRRKSIIKIIKKHI